jgi:hypothetical protein
VNFKQNPVKTSESANYYSVIKESCPKLIALDDEIITDKFYEAKVETIGKTPTQN